MTIRENIVKEKEKAREEIESELNVRFVLPHLPSSSRLIGHLTLARPCAHHET
jgi:hypothetical protein